MHLRRRVHWHRPDRRAAALVACGALYLFLGYGYTGSRPTSSVRDALVTAEMIAPLWVWGLVWVAAGVACILSAVALDSEPGAWGFIAAELPPLGWGTWYLFGWLGTLDGHVGAVFGVGSERGWATCGLFWMLATFVFIIAGLIAPPRQPSPTARVARRLLRRIRR